MAKRIGEFLVEKGLITPAQVQQIMTYGHQTGLRFGEAGLALNLYTREQLIDVFGPNFAVDFFYLDVNYFPAITRDLLPMEKMLQFGVLPLGFKEERKLFGGGKRLLNLGMLTPARKERVEDLLMLAQGRPGAGKIDGIKIFLILVDQYLDVLRAVYKMGEDEIRKRGSESLDATLAMVLAGGT